MKAKMSLYLCSDSLEPSLLVTQSIEEDEDSDQGPLGS